MKPTIKDVAKKANVSVATVSRVLNNLSGYSNKTKQTVLKAMEELEYQPNAIARGLINKRTQTIGVLVPSVSSSFFSGILHGIEHYANQSNYSVMVCNTDHDGVRTLTYLQVLREKQVDGIILVSDQMRDDYYRTLKSMGTPVVMVSSVSQRYSVPYVKVDDKQAAYQATEYLIRKGHRNIAMIAGTKDDPIAGKTRVEGYLNALDNNGIPHLPERLVYGDFRYQSGRAGFEQLLRTAPDITAIFAASDEMAMGILSVAAERGISIPDQLSVIGYDNLKLAEMAIPPLTTVAQPLFEMGASGTEKLIALIENQEIAGGTIMQHEIVERKTVRTFP